jgi:serine/threonine-protein kinase
VEEAKTTVALSHPNIVPVYELGVEQGTYFLAMELVEGVSIADLLRERNADGRRRVLTPEEGAYVGMEVCRALDYAHRRMKVVHRDITPRNVMIDEEGQVKLIDFGIAAPALVAGHEILGSPGHMPPEQVEGGELGPPTDIFALAVLLMEAWTGSAPFRRPTPEECDAAMREPHPVPSDFDARFRPLDDAMRRAMALEPRERQQDANELGRVFRSFLGGADPGDIARALGDRVRQLREAHTAPAPPSKANDAPRSAMGSAAELGTKTFAARDEALHWSSPPPAVAPPPELPFASSTPADSPSTRRLDGGALPEARQRPSPKDDPAMSIPTPLMVEPVGDLEDARRAAAAIRRSDPPADRVETVATRPFETPVMQQRSRTTTVASRARKRKRANVALFAIAGGLLIGGVVFWRANATPPKERGASAPIVPTTPSPPTHPSTMVSAQPPKEIPKEPTVPTAVTAASPSAPAAAARASVMLLGDPGTRVAVDGVPRGLCPTKLTLDPGSHDVRFTFDQTGESRGERVNVKAGERVTVRADFAGATPTVRVSRQ